MTNSLEQQLELFREAYHSVRVRVGSDDMVYRVSRGYADKAAKLANKLITDLGLSLVAIPTTLISKDSFIVKSDVTSDL